MGVGDEDDLEDVPLQGEPDVPEVPRFQDGPPRGLQVLGLLPHPKGEGGPGQGLEDGVRPLYHDLP